MKKTLFLCICALFSVSCSSNKKESVNVVDYDIYTPLFRECIVNEKPSLVGYEVDVKYDNKKKERVTLTEDDYALTLNVNALGKQQARLKLFGLDKEIDFSVNVCDKTEPLTIKSGQIIGYNNNQGVNVYRGIPYAKAPTGELRFSRPQPLEKYDGVKECIHWGDSAIQNDTGPYQQYTEEFIFSNKNTSENCLTLNVWSNDSENVSKPVVVYVHGGGFTTGASNCEIYRGDEIAQEGVVFVSMNYRLGALGFLCTEELVEEDHEAAGNYAILDVMESLKWVQENIAYFHGNPNNVTIMGQSAGGSMVANLLRTPKAKGLYHKAVLASSSQLEKENPSSAYEIEHSSNKKSLKDLRAITDTKKLANLSCDLGGVYDGELLTTDSYLNAYLQKEANDVPLLVGCVNGDGDSLETSAGIRTYEERLRRKAEYSSPVYVYGYDHATKGPTEASTGCFHTYDIPYWLGNFSSIREGLWTEEDHEISKKMMTYLVNFIRKGNPNYDGGVKWEENIGEFTYMSLGDEFGMKNISESAVAKVKESLPKTIEALG